MTAPILCTSSRPSVFGIAPSARAHPPEQAEAQRRKRLASPADPDTRRWRLVLMPSPRTPKLPTGEGSSGMQILSFEVIGLHGSDKPRQLELHHDLNILTGYNGSGKTTLLKLMWYLLSGNVRQALIELEFKRATLKTDLYILEVSRVSENTCKGVLNIGGDEQYFEDVYDSSDDLIVDARDEIGDFTSATGTSLFFPTFRRIEGGFTVNQKGGNAPGGGLLFNAARSKNDLQDAVLSVSRRLSNGGHTFVTSISTVDIVELILKKYTDLSERAGDIQRRTTQDVVERIKRFRRGSDEALSPSNDDAEELLDNVQSLIESVDDERARIMAPLEAIQSLGAKVFRHSGVAVGTRLSFGNAANAINSDALSAGEKQMLSFICYNALTENSVIFIDEPELSLHVDWQRLLFPTLLGQDKSNQFIIATHSPFIYSKYPDKEILLSNDRGDIEGDLSVKAEISVDEAVSVITRSSLPTVITEGDDDYVVYRKIEDNASDLGISLFPVGGKSKAITVWQSIPDDRRESVMLLLDRDCWIFTGVPREFSIPQIILTEGYSVENDLYRDGDWEALLSGSERRVFDQELEVVARWFSHRLAARENDPSLEIAWHAAHVLAACANESLGEGDPFGVLDDYQRLLRGKTLLDVLIRQLSRRGRAVKHNRRSLMEAAAVRRASNFTRIENAIRKFFDNDNSSSVVAVA